MRFALALILLSATAQTEDADLAKPTNLEKLNTKLDETDPYLTPDNLNLLYASNASGRYEIFLAKRTLVTAAWPTGNPFVTLNDADARTPFAYKGYQYFSANIVPDEKFAKLKNFDLYKRVDQGAPIPLILVSQREDEMKPWVTSSGGEFYFSRKMKDGWTQYVALGPAQGPIGKAKEVGFGANFSHATISASGLTMFLQGPLDKDRLGIFKSTRSGINAAWTKPEPVKKLNHPEGKRGDLAPCLSSDGLRLYFASDRPGGKGGLDVWVVPLAQLK